MSSAPPNESTEPSMAESRSPALPHNNTKPSRAWVWPWVVVFVAIYIFAVPWIHHSIWLRYLIHHDWTAALPGLGTTMARKITMAGHMTAGALAILIAPFQFFKAIRKSYPAVHRWMGRFYVMCGILASIFGNMFIILKGFHLSGGYNMGLAFCAAGIFLGYCAYMCYYTAKRKEFERHFRWVIRSVGQMWAPMLYRYYYTMIFVLRLRSMDDESTTHSDCHKETQTCDGYFRLFDAIHCWTYWIFTWLVSELIIYCLPASVFENAAASIHGSASEPDLEVANVGETGDNDEDNDEENSSAENQEAAMEEPLLPSTSADPASPGGTFEEEQDGPVMVVSDMDARESPPSESTTNKWNRFNAVGAATAVVVLAMTLDIFVNPPV